MHSVYCVIVTYNGMQWIEKCLNSLRNSIIPLKVILIDNGSKDLTVSFIRQNYPEVQLIETRGNKGFGQGNNIGLKIALEELADHIFLVNQDVYIEPDTIAALVTTQKENPEFGILSPLHLNGQGTDFDDHFFEYLQKSAIRDLLFSSILHKPCRTPVISTPFVNAAAWLISRDCLKATGGFDPIFFHYGEDDNYAQRVLFNGFKLGILHTTKIYHDKERPLISEAPNVQLRLKKDWINFLNQPCNIQNNRYVSLIVKRCCRYSFLTVTSLLSWNKREAFYNFSMAKKIAFAFTAVRKSRRISLNKSTVPHLY